MYKTIIFIDNNKKLFEDIDNIKKELSEDGNLFVLMSTEYDNDKNVKLDFFDIIEFCLKNGFEYNNTIVYPTNKKKVSFVDNVKYIIWFCKDKNKFIFNKDKIREKHIWKDVEWGKREKNYNPKGKDPGNVWIPTEDDGKANITKHILLEEEEIIKKLTNMTEASIEETKIYRGKNDINFSGVYSTCNINNKMTYDTSDEFNTEFKVYLKTSEDMNSESFKIKTAITSPPYWNLKDYFKVGQIGQESYDEYLDRMQTVWKNIYDKLSDDGSLWININIRTVKKKPILIPKDIIRSCKKIGYYYKGIIIWHKSSGIPRGSRNISDHHEYILIFSKDKNFSINFLENMKISDYKNIHMNNGAFWNINRKAGSVGKKYVHPAIYPLELVNRIIKISSNQGEYVLDPFLGSGTTLISSFKLKRNFVGYEYNEQFKDLIKFRLLDNNINLENITFIE